MGLAVKRLSFSNFRNYRDFSLENLGQLTVLVGPNAIGKTNVVEGIQLLTALYSFRHPTIDQMVRDGEGRAVLEADISDDKRLLTIALHMQDKSKKYLCNGKAKRAHELKGLLPAVSFTPDDLHLVKGAMAERRSAIDALGSQMSPNHYLIKKDYEKVVKYKNRLLKDDAPSDLLESINDMVITCGAQLVCYRVALLKKMIPFLIDRYASISAGADKLSLRYVPSWVEETARTAGVFHNGEESAIQFDSKQIDSFSLTRDVARETLEKALRRRAGEERARKKSVVGPHADRIEFYLDGKDASLYGSQGQQRSIVLAFKLAEAAVIEEHLNQKPVMLLDDVMSELDPRRREALVEFVVRDVQTFITTANLQYFDEKILEKADVVRLGD